MYWKQMTTNLGVTKQFFKINIVFCVLLGFLLLVFLFGSVIFVKILFSNNEIRKNN
jgi:hypothetical protein